MFQDPARPIDARVDDLVARMTLEDKASQMVNRTRAIPALDTQRLMRLFRHDVLKNLLAAGRMCQTTIDILDRFHHPGFSAYEGEGVSAGDSAARERLASYLANALVRLPYRPESDQVICHGSQRERCGDAEAAPARIFPALDFLASLCTHIPDTGQQLVRYYGALSNVRRARAGAGVSDPAAVPLPRRARVALLSTGWPDEHGEDSR
ncbi:MAG: transposase [Acidobacteria bacterium]|nr:transposase [Acidobacteriota bacterium]